MSATRDLTIRVDVSGDTYCEPVPGFPVRVVSETEAEYCDAVICGAESHFADDVRASCAICSAAIVHRPSAPSCPQKICVSCFIMVLGPSVRTES